MPRHFQVALLCAIALTVCLCDEVANRPSPADESTVADHTAASIPAGDASNPAGAPGQDKDAEVESERKLLDEFWGAFEKFDPTADEVEPDLEQFVVAATSTNSADLRSLVAALKKLWAPLQTSTTSLWQWGAAYYTSFTALLPYKRFKEPGKVMALGKCEQWTEGDRSAPSRGGLPRGAPATKGDVKRDCKRWFTVSVYSSDDTTEGNVPGYVKDLGEYLSDLYESIDEIASLRAAQGPTAPATRQARKASRQVEKHLQAFVENRAGVFLWLRFWRAALVRLEELPDFPRKRIRQELRNHCSEVPQCVASADFLAYNSTWPVVIPQYHQEVERFVAQYHRFAEAVDTFLGA